MVIDVFSIFGEEVIRDFFAFFYVQSTKTAVCGERIEQ